MTKTNEWEVIDSRGDLGDTCRMRIASPNGYLYRERACADRDGVPTAIALVFVPIVIEVNVVQA